MALSKSKFADLPEGVVVVEEKEALKYQTDLVSEWPKTSEVFALRYGPYILGTAALLNGAFFNNYFRWKMRLGHYGRFSSYLPVCIIPAVLAMFLHTEVVYRQILLMKSEHCPVCLETRAALIQAGFGVGFPLVFAPLGVASLSLIYGTYDLPSIHQEPKKVFNVFRKMFAKIQTKTFYAMIGQAFLGSVVTYFEASNLLNMHKTLARYEASFSE